jgi:hypothetical protein
MKREDCQNCHSGKRPEQVSQRIGQPIDPHAKLTSTARARAAGTNRRYLEDAGYIERGKLRAACQKFSIAYQSAKNAVWVCRSFQRSRRIDHLTFNHHQLIANHPAAAELLEWAEESPGGQVSDIDRGSDRRSWGILGLPFPAVEFPRRPIRAKRPFSPGGAPAGGDAGRHRETNQPERCQ